MDLSGKRDAVRFEDSAVEETLSGAGVIRSQYKTVDKLHAMYTNADGLINKRQELKVLLNSLKYRPHLIAVTEIKPKSMKGLLLESEFNLNGYQCFCHGLDDPMARGLVIYVDHRFSMTLVDIPTAFKECMFLMLKSDNFRFLIGNVYRSPNSSNENDRNLNSLLDYLEMKFRMPTLLVGDFNFSNIEWYMHDSTSGADTRGVGLTETEMIFINSLRENLFHQHVVKPTRQRGTDIPHILDLIITSDNFITDIEHLSPLGMSDHSVLIFGCQQSAGPVQNTAKFNFDKGNYSELRELLTRDWENVLMPELNTVEEMWETFKSILHDGMIKTIPKSRGYTASKKNFQPFSRELHRLIHRKHRLWNRWIKHRNDPVYAKYKQVRNKVKSEMVKLTRQEQEDISLACKSNPKKFWRFVNRKTKSKVNIGDLAWQDDAGNNKIAETDKEKAIALESYFSSVFSVEDDQMFEKLPSRMSDSNKSRTDFRITEEDIISKLSKLKVNKSPGLDLLHPRVLYEIRESIALPLCFIYNKSISSGVVPEDWKMAEVIAIHKKGSRSDRGNYRPVSLTSICCKILESIIRDHIMNHMSENKLLSDKQFGFIKGRSTMLQLLHMLDKWTRYLEEGGQVDAIYTDFEKAFDKVPHKRLISKLQAYGINDILVNWIKDFLTGRQQQVRVNGSYSGWGKVTSGIPQGSVLGPVLFLLYINDLVDCCDGDPDMYLFADDAKIFKHILNPFDYDKVQNGLDALQEWSSRWLLNLNSKKCKVISFGRNVDKTHVYYVKGKNQTCNLNRETQINDLGVVLDEKLTFKDHLHAKVNKAFAMIGIIKRNFKYLSISSFTLLYKSIVRSHLDYCSSVWAPYRKGDIEELEKVQRRATKIVPALKNLAYRERLKKCNLPTLHYRRIRGDMIETYKILTGKYDNSVVAILTSVDPGSVHTRGNDLRLNKGRAKYDLRKYNFTNRVINTWNSLPNWVVKADTTNTFKNRLDKFWHNQEILYDYTVEIEGSGSRSEVGDRICM
jgi:hypothetical protein